MISFYNIIMKNKKMHLNKKNFKVRKKKFNN